MQEKPLETKPPSAALFTPPYVSLMAAAAAVGRISIHLAAAVAVDVLDGREPTTPATPAAGNAGALEQTSRSRVEPCFLTISRIEGDAQQLRFTAQSAATAA